MGKGLGRGISRVLCFAPGAVRLAAGAARHGFRPAIESMFSDFKSRGFGLMQSHIQKPDRLERLILVMSIALYWAVSCGAFAEQQAADSGLKRGL